MKVVIIGAGLAGSVASGAFAADKPVNYDMQQPREQNRHQAVMRLRDVNVAKYLGISVEQVTVWKAVAWGDQLYEVADMRMNNLYSLKLYAELAERSLRTLGRVTRWLIEGVPLPREVRWGHKLVSVEDGQLTFTDRSGGIGVDYDICISTIPMPVMLQAAGIPFTEQFRSHPIYVWRGKLGVQCSLHQTIYFPDPGTPVYRATVQGKQVIIECIDDTPIDLAKVLWFFGLEREDLVNDPMMTEQPMGKMNAINDDERRRYIYELTDRYGIYSLGRYAIWKPIRADHLVQDVDKIKRLAKLSSASAGYERNRARI